MRELEELQAIWQSQVPAGGADSAARRAGDEVRRYQRRQMRLTIVKTAALLVLLPLWAAYVLRWRGGTMAVVSGALLISNGVLAFMLAYWKNQIGLSRLNFAEPSLGFVREAVARLQRERTLFRKHFLWLGAALIAGLNLIWLGAFDGRLRLAFHLAGTAFCGAALLLAMRIRERRFRRDCGPLIEKLTAVRMALEEQA